MEDITIYIRHKDNKMDFNCPASIILGDLLGQISDRDPNFLPPNPSYVVVKMDASDKPLDNSKSLKDNGVQDGDVLMVGKTSHAG